MNGGEIIINPNITERLGLVFERSKRTIEWPGKEELIEGSDKLYQKHKGEFRDRLSEEFNISDDDILESVERAYWATVFMLDKMRKISPIKLRLPIKIMPDWSSEPTDRLVTEAEYKGKMLQSPVEAVIFKVSVLPIVDDVLKDNKKEEDYYFEYIIDTFKGVEEEMVKEKEKHTIERYASYLGAATHEWAHGLYFVYALNTENQKKKVHLLENAVNRMSLDFGHIDQEEYLSRYLLIDPEKRGRIWERDFLRANFPQSKRLQEVQVELGKLGNPSA